MNRIQRHLLAKYLFWLAIVICVGRSAPWLFMVTVALFAWMGFEESSLVSSEEADARDKPNAGACSFPGCSKSNPCSKCFVSVRWTVEGLEQQTRMWCKLLSPIPRSREEAESEAQIFLDDTHRYVLSRVIEYRGEVVKELPQGERAKAMPEGKGEGSA